MKDLQYIDKSVEYYASKYGIELWQTGKQLWTDGTQKYMQIKKYDRGAVEPITFECIRTVTDSKGRVTQREVEIYQNKYIYMKRKA